MSEVLIGIPAYNPPDTFPGYVKALSEVGFDHILVVNDGSRAEFDGIFQAIEAMPQCVVIKHAVNLGKGRALKSAFNYCLNHKEFFGMITVDCDGQHAVQDVLKVKGAMLESTDAFVLGCRDFNAPNVPPKSKFGNKLTRGVFRLLYGRRFSDTQTGLRGFTRQNMLDFIEVAGERFEYETNMLIHCCRTKTKIREVPIKTIYLNHNAETHFRPVQDSLLIYGLIFRNFFKYSVSSVLSFLLDIGLFYLLFRIVPIAAGQRILFATVLARIFSSLFNFFLNKQVVFRSDGSLRRTAVRYYGLCIVQMLVSAALVTGAYTLFKVDTTVLKIVVDSLLFCVSFQIQQRWVFKAKTTKS